MLHSNNAGILCQFSDIARYFSKAVQFHMMPVFDAPGEGDSLRILPQYLVQEN